MSIVLATIFVLMLSIGMTVAGNGFIVDEVRLSTPIHCWILDWHQNQSDKSKYRSCYSRGHSGGDKTIYYPWGTLSCKAEEFVRAWCPVGTTERYAWNSTVPLTTDFGENQQANEPEIVQFNCISRVFCEDNVQMSTPSPPEISSFNASGSSFYTSYNYSTDDSNYKARFYIVATLLSVCVLLTVFVGLYVVWQRRCAPKNEHTSYSSLPTTCRETEMMTSDV